MSWNRATRACIFEGLMDAEFYCEILDTLCPIFTLFIRIITASCRKMILSTQSCRAQAFFAEKGISWWHTPPESPDANPIENVWHELKARMYIRTS